MVAWIGGLVIVVRKKRGEAFPVSTTVILVFATGGLLRLLERVSNKAPIWGRGGRGICPGSIREVAVEAAAALWVPAAKPTPGTSLELEGGDMRVYSPIWSRGEGSLELPDPPGLP